MAKPDQAMRTTRPDAWSPTSIAVLALGGVLFALAIHAGGPFLLFLPAFVISVMAIAVTWFACDFRRRRIRRAFSIAAGIGVAVGITYHASLFVQWKDRNAFQARQAEFVRQVEDARAKQTVPDPLQIVVDYDDESEFATTNAFHYIIYDETDGAGPYRRLYWPYAKSSTGVISVNIPSTMQHMTGHFYSFRASN